MSQNEIWIWWSHTHTRVCWIRVRNVHFKAHIMKSDANKTKSKLPYWCQQTKKFPGALLSLCRESILTIWRHCDDSSELNIHTLSTLWTPSLWNIIQCSSSVMNSVTVRKVIIVKCMFITEVIVGVVLECYAFSNILPCNLDFTYRCNKGCVFSCLYTMCESHSLNTHLLHAGSHCKTWQTQCKELKHVLFGHVRDTHIRLSIFPGHLPNSYPNCNLNLNLTLLLPWYQVNWNCPFRL